MLNLPGPLLKEVIEEGLKQLSQTTTVIDKLFAHLTVDDRGQILHLVNARHHEVREGYPAQAAKVPVFAIVLGSEQEIDEPISAMVSSTHSDGVFEDEYGTWMQGTYIIFCCAENANVVAWMHSLLKFILLTYRGTLEEYGYTGQRLTAGDLLPDEQFQPPFPFVRMVQITMQYMETYPVDFEEISAVNVNNIVY